MKHSIAVGISSVFFLALSSFPANAELVKIGRSYQDGLEALHYVDSKTTFTSHQIIDPNKKPLVRGLDCDSFRN